MAKDRVWYFATLFLCGIMQCTQTRSSVVSSTKSQGSWSHAGEITCTLGKSLRSWGCLVDSSRSQGTPCKQGTCYFVIYNISLCNSVHTINKAAYALRASLEKVGCCSASSAASLSHRGEGGTVLLSVGDWLLSVTEWEVIFLLRPDYGLSHYGKKPSTTSGSRWSKGKANINSYDCWLYSETLCSELACFLCGLPSSQNYVLHAEQFNSSAILTFSEIYQLWSHRSMILNVASSLPSLSSVSLLCQLGVVWAVTENNLWVCMCFSKHQNHDECRDTLTLHKTPSYHHKKTPTNQRHKKGTGISRKLRNLLGVLSFNMEAYFCISASSSLVESDMDNWIILR